MEAKKIPGAYFRSRDVQQNASLNQIKMTDEKAIEIFTRLMFNGKIRQATRFITERMESGE